MGSLDIKLVQMPFEYSIEYAIAAGLSEESFEVKKNATGHFNPRAHQCCKTVSSRISCRVWLQHIIFDFQHPIEKDIL